ncbi:hypothetical protein I7I50_09662 [Histoplasma capsulatum G186AR]|uniref:Uncharacterized protein n=1 Tax=Ajellomyces capsulatus TaxID=5037 RepID=A0A8H8D004_AJECA|nr:hypothetical protein I7I52_07192 [Histoplasma capsulatum]QSS74463.1 hypothetical protein I7I50_09662 [Histoplasma capsulatum G186AR]
MLLKQRKKPKSLVTYLNPKLRISKIASLSTVNTQCYHMMFKNHPIWVSVNLTSLSNDEYKDCRRIIELASTELGIYLHQQSLLLFLSFYPMLTSNSTQTLMETSIPKEPEPVTE